tara:strand:- start:2155 stop:2601 length:447 start_codon:yes stop_codon:yes gene_type:complete
MKTVHCMLAALLFVMTIPAFAQGVALDNPRANREVIDLGLYPPDLIMRHQETLGISADQRDAMLKLVRAFQDEVAELQWSLQKEQQLMKADLAQDSIDPEAVMPRVERVLAMESEFKRAHFRLLIGIKNALSAEQIAMIQKRIRQRRS